MSAHRPPQHRPASERVTTTVDLHGLALTVGYEIEPAEDAEHYQFGTLPAHGEWRVPMVVVLDGNWYPICEVLAEPAIAEITRELNGVTA